MENETTEILEQNVNGTEAVSAVDAIVILPCPFCGADAVGPENDSPEKNKDSRWRISCESWCVSMFRKRKKDVIASWNARTK